MKVTFMFTSGFMSEEKLPGDEGKIAQVKEQFLTQAKGVLDADLLSEGRFTSFTDVVKLAVDVGATIAEIKAWGKECKLQPQTVNRALRCAGIRQRAERSDKGKKKDVDQAATTEVSDVMPDGNTDHPDPAAWASALMTAMDGDMSKAIDFVEQMLASLEKVAA